MNYKFCNECESFHWTNEECPPVYNIFHSDYLGDDPMPIHANNHYDAALKYAEYYNSNNDYCLMGETDKITVEKDGIKIIYKISAEPSVDYSAHEVS